MTKKIMVIKRDGSKEEFDLKKIIRVSQAAGLKKQEAQVVSKVISQWVLNLEKDEVSSLKIRDQVLQELKKYNHYAAGLYQWYEQNKK